MTGGRAPYICRIPPISEQYMPSENFKPYDRRKLAKISEDYGFIVQHGVFECIMDKKMLVRIISQIYKVVLYLEET